MQDDIYANPLGLISKPPSKWPKVIGIIGMVFGAAALLSGGVMTLAPSVARGPYEQMGVPDDFFERHWMVLRAIPPVDTGMAVLLLIGSLLLLLRKRAAGGCVLTWAAVKICLAFWQLRYTIPMQREMIPLQIKKIAEADPASAQVVGSGAALEAMNTAATVLGVMLACALPIFILIWFLRKKIREEVAGWNA